MMYNFYDVRTRKLKCLCVCTPLAFTHLHDVMACNGCLIIADYLDGFIGRRGKINEVFKDQIFILEF